MLALGINVGSVIIVLVALYFVIRYAVRDGMKEAYKELTEKDHSM